MIVPIWRAVLPLAVFAASGAALDRVLGLEIGTGVGKWPRWTLCGLVACFAAALHPVVLAALLALAVAGRLAKGRAQRTAPPNASAQGVSWLGLAAAVLTLVVVCRPATLVYWDSFVWLAKARIESEGWGALRTAALDRSADIVPSGYPLFWPMAASWLSMGGHSMDALAAGAAAMTLVTLMLFLDAVGDTFYGEGGAYDGRGARPRWAPAVLGLLGVTPLVFVHLRSAYADLPVGLLAATCTLRVARSFERHGERAGDLAVAAIAAAALAGLKDEGAAHVAAMLVAAVVLKLWSRERLPLWPVLVVFVAAAIPFNGWRVLLHQHHIGDFDHQPTAPDLGSAGAIGRTILGHLTDTRSWGALWPIAIACAALVLARGRTFRAATRFATLTFLGEAVLLLAALVFGPARVRVFAFEGTLVNRLLLQLVPPAGVMLVLALGDAAAAWQAVRRPATQSLPIPSPGAPVPVMTRSPE
jgi:hypothetical protein